MQRIIVIALLLLSTTSFAQNTTTAPPPNLPKVAVGMSYDVVMAVLQKSKWEKLDEQKTVDTTGLQRTITYRWDTVGLTVPKKYIHSLVVLTFKNDALVKMDRYTKDKKPLEQDIQQFSIW